MEPNWKKLDSELKIIYANYLDLLERDGDPKAWRHSALKNDSKTVFLTLTHQGNEQTLKQLGIKETYPEREGVTNCVIELSKIAELSHHESIYQMIYGKSHQACLNNSTINIKARGSTPGVNSVWSVNQVNGSFDGKTGENIIIGIIDTGIDYKHDTFKKIGLNKTRILRIWDQGLIKELTEKEPDVGLLSSGPSYGVEYTNIDINKELEGISPDSIRHKDCDGHGTHVAGTAAGNGQKPGFKDGDKFEYVGVAPKADLVIVKYIDLENTPPVNRLKRFKDAITYIIKIGELYNKPVAINCSFGNALGPHDGLDEGTDFGFNGFLPPTDGRHIFLENTFRNAIGKICIFSAGNYAGSRAHAIVTIPDTEEIDIPIILGDKAALRQSYVGCKYIDNRSSLSIDCWYKDSINGVKASFNPLGRGFGSVIAKGHYSLKGVIDRNRKYSIDHNRKIIKREGVDLRRSFINITVNPHDNQHREGVYILKLEGPENSKIHIWLEQGHGYFIFDKSSANPNIEITDLNTMGSPGDSPYVINTTAYTDDPIKPNKMVYFSSQGPLVDYSEANLGPLAEKPTIAAPGEAIFSSRSYDAPIGLRNIDKYMVKKRLCIHYRNMQGTSMAAPHITGVVALMLEKNKELTLNTVKTHFKALTAPLFDYGNLSLAATKEACGKGAIDTLETLKNVPNP